MAVAARLKRAVRHAIALSGGIESAAITTHKSESTAGRWNNRNDDATPTLADAFALDELAVIAGNAPPILTALAAELGHVAIRLPDGANGEEAVLTALLGVTAEVGDIASSLRDAMADGRIDGADPDKIIAEIDEAHIALARMRALLAGVGGDGKHIIKGVV